MYDENARLIYLDIERVAINEISTDKKNWGWNVC